MSPTAGQFVTETLEYDGGRQVTVYVPPDPADAIVFAGDGGWHISRLVGALDAATDAMHDGRRRTWAAR